MRESKTKDSQTEKPNFARRLREFLRRYLKEIVAFLSLEAALFVLFRWREIPTERTVARAILFAVFLCSVGTLAAMLVLLWKTKWKRFFADTSRAVLARVTSALRTVIGRIFDRLNLRVGAGAHTITGTATIIFDTSGSEKLTRATRKVPKWRQTQSDRERLRLLYRYMISYKLKHGMRASSVDTPSELKKRAEHAELEGELFDLYVESRYDERTEPPEAKIAEIKSAFEDEWTIK